MKKDKYILAFDSSNETIAIAIGKLSNNRQIKTIATKEIEAKRASNTQLIPQIDKLLTDYNIKRSDIFCIGAGRGPGSFTGVRICLSTAKGIASSLKIGLIGLSTLDSVA